MFVYEVTSRSTGRTHYVEATSAPGACETLGWRADDCRVRMLRGKEDRVPGEAPPENAVWFTQFMMPDGQQRRQHIVRPTEIAEKARAVEDHGGRFEMEMLSDYTTVSLACTWEQDGEVADRVSVLCPNGPEVESAVDSIVRQAHEKLCCNE